MINVKKNHNEKKGREFDVSDIENQNGKTVRKKEKQKKRTEKKRREKERDNGTTSPQLRPKHTKSAGVSQTNHDTQQ